MLTLSKSLNCCVCRGNSASRFFKWVDDFQLMKCPACQVIHLNDIKINPESFLDDVTNENEGKLEYWGYPEYFKKYSDIFSHFFSERFERIKPHAPNGTWLDVGTGFGLWQSYLQKKEISNFGIEIEKKSYQYSSSQGLKVENISIEKFSPSEKFAVITMCDVLEHVESPYDVLRNCFEMLQPGGVIYIQVPCVIGARVPYGDSLGLPHHLWQFNERALRMLGSQVGFKFVKSWTGIQGVIKYHEMGGPSLIRKIIWKLAMWSKRGNRLQLLLKK